MRVTQQQERHTLKSFYCIMIALAWATGTLQVYNTRYTRSSRDILQQYTQHVIHHILVSHLFHTEGGIYPRRRDLT